MGQTNGWHRAHSIRVHTYIHTHINHLPHTSLSTRLLLPLGPVLFPVVFVLLELVVLISILDVRFYGKGLRRGDKEKKEIRGREGVSVSSGLHVPWAVLNMRSGIFGAVLWPTPHSSPLKPRFNESLHVSRYLELWARITIPSKIEIKISTVVQLFHATGYLER